MGPGVSRESPPAGKAEYAQRQAGYQRTAAEIVKGVEPNPRRQDKVIAALVRREPSLILRDSVALAPGERDRFTSHADMLTRSDVEAVIAGVPAATNPSIPADEAKLRSSYAKFEGDDTVKRRMRRVIAETTRGSLDHPNDVTPQDLLDYTQRHFPNAVAFEANLPELVEAIDERKLGITNYRQAINEVGLALYGSQWVYLQQLRLAQAEAIEANALSRPTAEPVARPLRPIVDVHLPADPLPSAPSPDVSPAVAPSAASESSGMLEGALDRLHRITKGKLGRARRPER